MYKFSASSGVRQQELMLLYWSLVIFGVCAMLDTSHSCVSAHYGHELDVVVES